MEKNLFGILFYKIGDIGPEIIYKQNIPPNLKHNFTQSTIELGVWLSLVISQGKGLSTEGLVGPLPFHRIPEYELFVFSFLANNPDVYDKRKENFGTMHFLVIFFRKEFDALVKSKLALKKELEDYFIREEGKHIITKDFINKAMKHMYVIIGNSIQTGKNIIKEKAIDNLLNYEDILELALFTIPNLKLYELIKGKAKKLPKKRTLQTWFNINSRIVITDTELNCKLILMKFYQNNLLFYARIRRDELSNPEIIELLNDLQLAFEMIVSYA